MTGSAHESLWRSPPEPLTLAPDEVHVWRAKLDLPGHMQHMRQTLALEERTRASRFRFATDRARFIAARGILRTILGRYLHTEPRALRFAYNGYGKPMLIEEPESGPIFFNLTHSQGMALYAFTQSGEVGIDLEQITTETKDYEQIASRFFSPAESAELRALPAEQRAAAFLNGWTRKEAYIKARGLGVSLDLSLFDVSLTPGVPAALLATRETGQDSASWSLYDLFPGPDYVAALAVKGQPVSIACWQWLPF